ncbi:type II toxin-antitoxin system RelE/ParE family toxin [Pseudomonas xanthosomatis]|uniref:type II toxin-antitoxin system RelE/ParE family toxin n=1 Tax=Pseudomonas xanthosomatis TaxID=2842356 RepID=UPI003516CF32
MGVPFLVHLASSDQQVRVLFFRSALGNEPVREWLKALSRHERQIIGTEIKTVQIGWPLGMPLVRKLESGLWEIRIDLADTVGRVLFTISDGVMVLLHGFIKKSQKTPAVDLAVARQRKASLRRQTT